MTTSSTYRIEPADVARITFECADPSCGALVSYKPGTTVGGGSHIIGGQALRCPGCHADWVRPNTQAWDAIRALGDGIRELAAHSKDYAFRVSLEVPPKSDAKG